MDSPTRPVEPLDILPRQVLIHAGLVFSGHLDIPRLQQAAGKVVDVYPELNVCIKSTWFTLGTWSTPPAEGPVWDFKHRDWPDKALADVFKPAAMAVGMDLASSSKVTSLGAVETAHVQDLFVFEGPPVASLGRSPIPTLSFRVTRLGGPQDGHTLLSMSIPHFITDAMGAGGLIEAWGRLYRGEMVPTRTEEPHPDLVKALDAVPVGDRGGEMKDNERPGLGLRTGIIDFLSYARDLWRWSSQGCEERYVHFPRQLLEKYRDRARLLLTDEDHGLPVSCHDVFCAMMLKMYARSSLISDDTQPFDFYYVYSLAAAFPAGALPQPYLHNINVPGWFPLPSSAAVSATPLPELAVTLRRRLNALRTVNNVRETLLYQESKASGSLLHAPRVDGRHGWGMVSSWGGVEGMAGRGFEGEELVFHRPAIQVPGDIAAPNIAFSIGDGHGGVFARVTVVKGDWDEMWAKSGLGDLE